jgi:hypothetical protein
VITVLGYSLVRITEKLLEWKSSGTLYRQILAPTSPICGGLSVCIVRLQTKATEFSFSALLFITPHACERCCLAMRVLESQLNMSDSTPYNLCNVALYISVVLQIEYISSNAIIMIMLCRTVETSVISRSSCYHAIYRGENIIKVIVPCYGVETTALTAIIMIPILRFMAGTLVVTQHHDTVASCYGMEVLSRLSCHVTTWRAPLIKRLQNAYTASWIHVSRTSHDILEITLFSC